MLQVTARSLVGNEDKATKQCALALLEAGLVSLVASDAHAADSVLPHEAVDLVVSKVGVEAAQRIFVDNPERVLAGQFVPVPPMQRAGKDQRASRGFLSRILGPHY